jgi:hypothetical protein
MVGMLALSLLIAQAAAMGGFSGKMKFKHFNFLGQWIMKSVCES